MTTSVTGLDGVPEPLTAATQAGTAKSTKATDPNSPAAQKNLFLTMMIAQMKNQDPTSPMDANAMITQMSQMTSVEQMVNMSSSMSQMQDVSMIGKTVQFNTNAGASAIGTVAGVTMQSGTAQLVVLGNDANQTEYDIDPSQVTDIADTPAAPASSGASTAAPSGT